jgi:hypothetical protein
LLQSLDALFYLTILDLQVVGNHLPYKMLSGIFPCQVCRILSLLNSVDKM